jgi:HEAT repeats
VAATPDHHDFDGWVNQLADTSRSTRAYQHLVLSGDAARPAVLRGLTAASPAVRRLCTRALDHLIDEPTFTQLIAMLADQEPTVRVEALHALACDRCKGDQCRPNPDEVFDAAINIVRTDPDAHARAYACELVGTWVHTYPTAADALIHVSEHDPSPAVRKKARWYAPGGTINRRTAPTPPRRPAPDRASRTPFAS